MGAQTIHRKGKWTIWHSTMPVLIIATSTAAFRIPWGIQIVPAVILFFGMFFFPKTPRWLAAQDRWEEA